MLNKFLRLQDSLTGKLVGASYKTYNNTYVRQGQAVKDPKKHANGYVTHVENHFQQRDRQTKNTEIKRCSHNKKD